MSIKRNSSIRLKMYKQITCCPENFIRIISFEWLHGFHRFRFYCNFFISVQIPSCHKTVRRSCYNIILNQNLFPPNAVTSLTFKYSGKCAFSDNISGVEHEFTVNSSIKYYIGVDWDISFRQRLHVYNIRLHRKFIFINNQWFKPTLLVINKSLLFIISY